MKTMKNMPMRLIGALALVLMVAFNSCKEDEGVITPQFPELKEVSGQPGDTMDIAFSANLDWSIQSSAAWCKFVNGEFAETTSSGKAGDQTLKISISDESWNYQTEDVAEITLKMMDQTQVIYKITRGKKEYQDLVVVDSEGNKVGESFVIKGNTGSVTYSSLKASAEKGVKVGVKYPEWLIMTYNSASGYYDFTFNTDKETNGGLDFRYPHSDDQSFITFVTEDAETAETDKIRKVMLPVSYEGFDKGTVLIEPKYINKTVSYDGKVNVGGELLSELTSEITAFSNDFQVVVGEQTTKEINGDKVFAYDFNNTVNWLVVNHEQNSSVVKISFKENKPTENGGSEGEGVGLANSEGETSTTGPRSAIVLVLPRKTIEEKGTDYNSYLLDENQDLKSEFNTFQLLSCEQEEYVAVKEYKFRSRGFYAYGEFSVFAMQSFPDLMSENISGDDADEIRKQYQISEDNNNIFKLSVPYEYVSIMSPDMMDGTLVFDMENMDYNIQTIYSLTNNSDVNTEERLFKEITFYNPDWSSYVDTFKGLLLKADINKLPNIYDIAVKDAEGNIVSFCRLEFSKQTGGTSNN